MMLAFLLNFFEREGKKKEIRRNLKVLRGKKKAGLWKMTRLIKKSERL